ncbi:MAG: Glyoxalase/bleomycin resistance protein/dioxygenase [Flaviaesturariibacter sp.]|nr:Glyoxalase/bleomycin resistance protein/dioxygenase [Flaviaesturariibacter sp.]
MRSIPDLVGRETQVTTPRRSSYTMTQRIAHITLLVADYDEAIEFYTKKLGFRLVEDTILDAGKRWVLVAPPGATECSLLLAKAISDNQTGRVGDQAGGRVFLFLHTDDFWRDYNALVQKGVSFVRPPEEFPYGTVAVFEDLYGNRWDLIQPQAANSA